jgi:hypothetical protein|tara:strand:+ start:2032 stop:2403 length:372 start_codon:yes stop_codon:yes gene_type:complete
MLLKDIEENYPFISIATYGGAEYVGIIVNQDQHVTSMYVYTTLNSDVHKQVFLDLGEIWWWESNRLIPVNIFLRAEFEPFQYALMTMNSKDVKVTVGPCVNLGNLSIKRIKRKSVQLVRRPKK